MTFEDDEYGEGDIIPLSKYETTTKNVGEVILEKWRKATTAEAILKSGYDQAVGATTDDIVKDIQKGIRKKMVDYMATGTGTASGEGLQAALAAGWGRLQVLWEDDAVDTVYFLNPMDIAEYLGKAQITMQTAFGMSYVENFLGLGTVFVSSAVPAGNYYATAKQNIVLHHMTSRVSCVRVNALEAPPAFLGKFDLVVSNPPYITTCDMLELPHSVAGFEPRMALHGGDDGLKFYRSIASQYAAVLKPGGYLCFEFGMGQGDAVSSILEANGYTILERTRDFNDRERAVMDQYGRKED